MVFNKALLVQHPHSAGPVFHQGGICEAAAGGPQKLFGDLEGFGSGLFIASTLEAELVVKVECFATEGDIGLDFELQISSARRVKVGDIPALADGSHECDIQGLRARPPEKSEGHAEICFASVVRANEEVEAGGVEINVQKTPEVIYSESFQHSSRC